MSSDEFMIPSNENNIVKYGIVGIVAVVVLGTIYCFMTKKLMFKNKKPIKKVEKFQPVIIDYNSKVERIIQDLMKDQGLYTKNNKFVIQNIIKMNSPCSPEILYKSYENLHPFTRDELIRKIRGLLSSQGLIEKLKGKVSEIFANNEKQINDKQLNTIALRISHEKDGGEDFLQTCAKISNEGPVPIGADRPADKIIGKLMEYGEMD
tara:strand:+ start:1580 stop:2200 length:621 start_codon:yes stop_codon:yes gene_type:complete